MLDFDENDRSRSDGKLPSSIFGHRLAYIKERDGLDLYRTLPAVSKLQILKDRRTTGPTSAWKGADSSVRGNKCCAASPDRVNDVAERYAILGVDSISETEKFNHEP